MRRLPRPKERTTKPEAPTTRLWSATTTCERCGDFTPCNCPATSEGNLAAVLVLFAAWRQCSACGLRVLFVDGHLQTTAPFLCGCCERKREALARACRPAPSMPTRAALHLWAMWEAANDNHAEARA